MATETQTFDIVLVGATGFTGGLTARYLAEHVPAALSWAIAGRSEAKLGAVADSLDGPHPPDGQVVVDVTEPASVRRLAEGAQVLATTVGPYVHHGEALVAACAAAGTDYLDLTGEPEFVDRMYLRHHDTAVASGARLVHCCGFDSIPHDLGAFFTVQLLPDDQPISLDGYVRAGGRPSGGTFHSAVTAFSRLREAGRAAAERRTRQPEVPGRRARAAVAGPGRRDGWTLPMPTVDPDVIVRSARALEAYGPDFTYRHHLEVDHLASALGISVGVPALVGLAQFGPTRRALLGRISPGDGPTEAQRDEGWFEVSFVGRAGDQEVHTRVSGGDPGYTETAKMLAETALSLALDDLPDCAGQVTTAQVGGNVLIERLVAAGIEFRVLDPEA